MKIIFNTCFLSIIILLTACNNTVGPEDPPIDTPTLQSNVIIVESTSLALSEVRYNTSDSTFVYSYKAPKPVVKVNDVLVGRPIKVNINLREGYYRIVTSVREEGDKILVNTKSAALTDVIKNGDINDSFPILEDFPEGGIPFEFSYPRPPADTTNVNIKVKGRFRLNGYIDFGLKVNNSNFEKLETKFVGDIGMSETDVEITYTIAKSETTWKTPKPIYTYNKIIIIMAGPVPIAIDLSIDITPGVTVGFEGSVKGEIKGINFRTKMEAGLEYNLNSGPRRIINIKTALSSQKIEVVGNIEFYVKPFLEIEIDAKLYSIAGVAVTPTPYVKASVGFTFPNPKLYTKGDLGVEIGGKITFNKLLKPLVSDIELFKKDIHLLTLWDESISFPKFVSAPLFRNEIEIPALPSPFIYRLDQKEPIVFNPSNKLVLPLEAPR